ncbi:hypothetical protein B0H13DRAFT_437397 [Mycena leptocephala]|nr:hypothetical protein B0H13DRAFT_437397 [Mycena leptocephala]
MHARACRSGVRGAALASQHPSPLDLFSTSRYSLTSARVSGMRNVRHTSELILDCLFLGPACFSCRLSRAFLRHAYAQIPRGTPPHARSCSGTWNSPPTVKRARTSSLILRGERREMWSVSFLRSPMSAVTPRNPQYCTPPRSGSPPPSGIVLARGSRACPRSRFRTVSRTFQSKPAFEHDHLLSASSPPPAVDANPDTRADAAPPHNAPRLPRARIQVRMRMEGARVCAWVAGRRAGSRNSHLRGRLAALLIWSFWM